MKVKELLQYVDDPSERVDLYVTTENDFHLTLWEGTMAMSVPAELESRNVIRVLSCGDVLCICVE